MSSIFVPCTFYEMRVTPTPFDSDAPVGITRPIVLRDPDDKESLEIIDAVWGSNPRFTDGDDIRFVRSEGRTFPSHRCLVPMSEFHMKVGKKSYRVMLDTGQHFYVAGIWEPPIGTDAALPFFRTITVAANPEVARYQPRHGAIIFPRQVMQWLDGKLPVHELLVTPPKHIFIVEEVGQASPPSNAGSRSQSKP